MPTSRPLLAAATFLLAALAGCVGDGDGPAGEGDGPAPRDALTQPVHAIGEHLDHTFIGTTGTQLYVDYVLPEPIPEGGAPVILVFTPYQDPDLAVDPGEGGGVGSDPPYNVNLTETYVPYGYAVAFADVRGNHNAGGCIDQTGPQQWQDGYDYVEWLGTQPWSNGKVGMYGASYDGETQFTTAMLAPPHLATIVPVASVSNQYEWSFYQGVPYELQPFIGMFSYFQGSAVPSTDPANAPRYPEKLECQAQQFGAGLDFSGDQTAFWRERDYRPMAKQIKASVLHVHGLADWNVRPIHVDPLFNDIDAEKRAVFGQWGHAYPNRDDWRELLHAWYDHFLFGRNTGILERLPPVLVEDSTGQWHGIDSFPPLDAQWLELELSADGRLVAPGNATAGDLYLADYPSEVLADPGLPARPFPDGAAFQDPAERVFAWTTPVDLHVVGRPEVRFTATTDTTSTHWVAHLDWGQEGCPYAVNPTSRNGCPNAGNAGYQDTRHRDGFDDPKDLEPGVAYNLTVRMYPQYDVIPAGSEVRLTLTNNDGHVSQDNTFARNLLHVGGGQAVLRLPLHHGGVLLPEDTLPDPYPGRDA
jgi:putative CocE/NonD family hydrolase